MTFLTSTLFYSSAHVLKLSYFSLFKKQHGGFKIRESRKEVHQLEGRGRAEMKQCAFVVVGNVSCIWKRRVCSISVLSWPQTGIFPGLQHWTLGHLKCHTVETICSAKLKVKLLRVLDKGLANKGTCGQELKSVSWVSKILDTGCQRKCESFIIF